MNELLKKHKAQRAFFLKSLIIVEIKILWAFSNMKNSYRSRISDGETILRDDQYSEFPSNEKIAWENTNGVHTNKGQQLSRITYK